MFHSYNGPRRDSRQEFQRRPRFGNRPPQRRGFGMNRANIHHSKYINKNVESIIEEEVPVTNSFEDFGLDPALLRNVIQHGYETPTPIQDQAIPLIMEGKDVVGLANTGTGKTAAFLLPLINQVLLDQDQGVMIVAPTRELVLQIGEEWQKFVRGLNISMAMCIGGASIGAQIHTLKRNPHFVIGTPGRLKDLINRGALNTEMFKNIVLDEVDRMLDIGFVRDIRFLISHLPEERQSYFFSATMTREVEDVMRSFSQNPIQVSVKKRETSNHIHQDIIRVEAGSNKTEVLFNLLQQSEFEKVIVFGRTKHGINKLEEILSKRGIRVSSIHGNKTQSARQYSLRLFKQGSVQALLATDVAARGIDIEGVTHVINFDEPQTYDDYIHRIGRTGRAGKEGKALTFVS
jgi:ATP-dependent RNA helicase RhlE